MEYAFEIYECNCECGCKRIDQDYVCEICKAGLCRKNDSTAEYKSFLLK
jgi:hypothetical protein